VCSTFTVIVWRPAVSSGETYHSTVADPPARYRLSVVGAFASTCTLAFPDHGVFSPEIPTRPSAAVSTTSFAVAPSSVLAFSPLAPSAHVPV
jgi:hypothetical protein